MDGGTTCRHIGSGARGLMKVACGRAEAVCEAHLDPWDAMAAVLLVREAGVHADFPCAAKYLRRGVQRLKY